MPITDGKYVNPGWRDRMTPTMAARELQDLCDSLEHAFWPELFVTLADSGTTVTAQRGGTTVTLTETDGVWWGKLDSLGTWTVRGTVGGSSVTMTVDVGDVRQYDVRLVSPNLAANSWLGISSVAQEGAAGNYWSVGDTKSVVLNGTMGTLSLNTTLWVYIIGINHRSTNGVTFQGFKTVQASGADVCLVDSKNGTNAGYSGDKYFQLNHWGTDSTPYNTNYGGWAACDMRYDILGSTNVAPTPYGSIKTTDATGSNPTSTCATNPVSNTLMSCLPSDLRSVMRPMTVYTNNKGNGSNVAANVTATIDYLPLLAEFEIFGTREYANQYEQDYQSQYTYYADGNSKVKYKHNSTGSVTTWWERSPPYSSANYFCFLDTSGIAGASDSRYSRGLAPVFLM